MLLECKDIKQNICYLYIVLNAFLLPTGVIHGMRHDENGHQPNARRSRGSTHSFCIQ